MGAPETLAGGGQAPGGGLGPSKVAMLPVSLALVEHLHLPEHPAPDVAGLLLDDLKEELRVTPAGSATLASARGPCRTCPPSAGRSASMEPSEPEGTALLWGPRICQKPSCCAGTGWGDGFPKQRQGGTSAGGRRRRGARPPQ